MSMKTQEQVTAEIAALVAIKPRVPKHTALGDDNHAGIDAQVEVLTEGMDSNQVHQKFLYELDEPHTFFEALYACDWLHGDLTDGEEKEAPSVGWQSLTE